MTNSDAHVPASRLMRIVTVAGAGVITLPVVLVPAILALPMSAVFSWLGLGSEYQDLMSTAGQRLKQKVASAEVGKPRKNSACRWAKGMDPGFGVSHSERLDEAEVFMAYGRLAQSAAIVGEVLQQDPSNERARTLRALLLEGEPDVSSTVRRHLNAE